LGKHAGDRLPHPEDPHQFLRCVTADSAWVETCPDKLFYNPHSQICDWDTLEKMTTTNVMATVKGNHAVLVRFKPRGEGVETVGRLAVDTQVIQDTEFAAVSPRTDVVLTVAPVQSAVVPPVVSTSVAVEHEVTPALEVIQVPHQVVSVAGMQSTTPRAEFVLPPVVESATEEIFVATTTVRSELEVVETGTTPRAELEIISTTVAAPVPIVEVTTRLPTIVQTTVLPVAVVSETTVAPLVAESVDREASVQRELLQQRVQQLQQELMRVQQQVQQGSSIVPTTTLVARFVMPSQ
jgi:hypothetical protein